MFLTYTFYTLYIRPRRLQAWYAKQCDKLGLKCYVFPFKPLGAPLIEKYGENFKKHSDSLKTLKELAGYDVVIHNVLNKVFLEVFEPEMLKDILQPQIMQPKYRTVFGYFTRAFGFGLLFSEKEVWKAKKKILNQVFNFDFIKSNIPKIMEVCDKQMSEFEKMYLEKNPEAEKGKFQIEMLHLYTGITSNVMSAIFFGYKADRKI